MFSADPNDLRTHFMNWALMANEAWDYPADSIGFMTGLALELNQPRWAVRYGFFSNAECLQRRWAGYALPRGVGNGGGI